jgi:hypothetical protein
VFLAVLLAAHPVAFLEDLAALLPVVLRVLVLLVLRDQEPLQAANPVVFPEEPVAPLRVAWVLRAVVLLVHLDQALLQAVFLVARPAVHPVVFLVEPAALLPLA